MEVIYVGPTGSGKTTKLYQKYKEVAQQTSTDDCLVLVNDATSVRDWRRKIDLESIGSLHIYSYFSFLQQEIKRYWDLIEGELAEGRKVLEPLFMTVEPAHYLMSKLVEKEREKGYFIDVKSTMQQIAVQLIDNLNHAALNGLSLTEAKERLLILADGDQDKQEAYQVALKVMKGFRRLCLERRCLDYSLLVELYNRYLLSSTEYYQSLAERYNYLIVDDLERMTPVGQELIIKLMEVVEDSCLAFNPEVSLGKFFGSAPELARERFVANCERVELEESYTASENARELARQLAEGILTSKEIESTGFIQQQIRTELRGDMLAEVASKVVNLLQAGVEANRIAIITPYPDKVLDFTLNKHLEQEEYSLLSLTKNRLLLDNPFAQALVVLTVLTRPDWELEVSQSALFQTLNLILEFDPVRSSLLAEKIKENDLRLPDPEESGLRAKLGFQRAEKYEAFRDWLFKQRKDDFQLEYFFRAAFGNILSSLVPDEDDMLACRQLIKSFVKFKEVMIKFKDFEERDLGARFIEMINEGTLAAELLYRPEDLEDKVILATPYTFLSFSYLEDVDYLFLLDASSELWLLGSSKELSNPHLLSKEEEELEWNDFIDQSLRKEQLAGYLQSMLSKVKEGLYVADSDLNSRGWEQTGQLAQWIEKI
ncbi:hypothetical protein MWH28_05850 [Natroniella sulfidigena]|uniref:hypothetical protein n=1 Tax=Natroniella sulfidigena TaxID=723921 RepID=UPI00200B704B|nr:hypothetical protein [Natroniella sulfidigena]MCK8816896.1 hypothetical protein [Natroniella sulfidigena]